MPPLIETATERGWSIFWKAPWRRGAKKDPVRVDLADRAKQFFDLMNHNDIGTLGQICTSDCEIEFPDAAKMKLLDFQEEMQNCFLSFPDTNFNYSGVSEVGKDTVIVERLVVCGTHTGAPYGFGPYPQIEAKGVKVTNDPEKVTFKFVNEKIARVIFLPLGELTGPPGFYQQIGGFPIM